jgi:hypothetical protein
MESSNKEREMKTKTSIRVGFDLEDYETTTG